MSSVSPPPITVIMILKLKKQPALPPSTEQEREINTSTEPPQTHGAAQINFTLAGEFFLLLFFFLRLFHFRAALLFFFFAFLSYFNFFSRGFCSFFLPLAVMLLHVSLIARLFPRRSVKNWRKISLFFCSPPNDYVGQQGKRSISHKILSLFSRQRDSVGGFALFSGIEKHRIFNILLRNAALLCDLLNLGTIRRKSVFTFTACNHYLEPVRGRDTNLYWLCSSPVAALDGCMRLPNRKFYKKKLWRPANTNTHSDGRHLLGAQDDFSGHLK